MRRGFQALTVLGVALLFGLSAWSSLALTAGFGRVAPIWIANGLVVAAMLLGQRQRALWFGLPAGGFAADLLLNLLYAGDAPGLALSIACANTLEICIAAYGLRSVRLTSAHLVQLKFVARFFLIGTIVAPCSSALVAACAINIERGTAVLEVMRIWIPADALGMAVVVPLVLALRPRELFARLRRGPSLKLAFSQLILLIVTIGVFSQTRYPLLFLLLPPLLLIIFHLEFNGAALAISTVATVAIIATLHGHGPLMLVPNASMAEHVFTLQLLLGSLIVTTYPLCAVLARHRSLVRRAERHVRALSASQTTVSALNEQMRLAAGAANIGFYTWDFTTNGILWDPQIYRMFHLDPDLGPAKYDAWRTRLHPQDLARTEQALQSTLAHGTDLDLDFRVVWPDGTERELRSCGVIQRDASGGRGHKLVGLTIDMTDLRRVDRMKSEFVSIVSHELRTPLTSIRGALGLLATGAVPAHKSVELVQLANRNAERLAILIDDLLDMERIESGKMRFDLQSHRLGEVMEQAIDANKAYAARHQVRLRLCNDTAAHACVDENRLLQVMANLLSNAAKFSPPGATVDVCVVEQHDSVRISVRDYGSGIPAEFQSKIFGKFCQSDGSDTRQRGGSGLGLAISKELVERMGGAISFITSAHMGTTFFVDLPLAEGNPDCMQTAGAVEIQFGLR